MKVVGYLKYFNSDGFITPVFKQEGADDVYVQNRMEKHIEFMPLPRHKFSASFVEEPVDTEIDENRPFYGFALNGKVTYGHGEDMEKFLTTSNAELFLPELVEMFKKDWKSHEYE